MNWVGETPTQECGCANRIAQMSAWGPASRRTHLDEIIGWLADEATRRVWWKYAVAVPDSRFFIKPVVLDAIRRAEAGKRRPPWR